MKCTKLLRVAAILAMASTTTHAADREFAELLEVLLNNGTISEQQYEKMIKIARSEADAAEPVEDFRVETKGGLEVASYNGEFSFELGGRLMLDAAHYDTDKNELGDGTEARRARLEVEGVLFSDWGYDFSIDFASDEQEVDVKDAAISYDGFWPVRITMGQFKEPFSLEELTSSKYTTFMERALPNEFAPGRNIGIGVRTHGEAWSASAGLFGEALDKNPKSEADEGWGVTGRLSYAPVHSDTRVLHLGVGASHRKPDDRGEIKFSARPESNLTDVKYLNTDDIEEVDAVTKYGLEFAGVYGPFSVQSEYIRAGLSRAAGAEDVDFDGWYAYASWFLTGESRAYKTKKGSFGKIKPSHRWGAWELAARYSTLDLNDGPVTGGEQENFTFGLNWYVNENMRFMANYILVNNDPHADDAGDVDGDDDPNVFQARVQLAF